MKIPFYVKATSGGCVAAFYRKNARVSDEFTKSIYICGGVRHFLFPRLRVVSIICCERNPVHKFYLSDNPDDANGFNKIVITKEYYYEFNAPEITVGEEVPNGLTVLCNNTSCCENKMTKRIHEFFIKALKDNESVTMYVIGGEE